MHRFHPHSLLSRYQSLFLFLGALISLGCAEAMYVDGFKETADEPAIEMENEINEDVISEPTSSRCQDLRVIEPNSGIVLHTGLVKVKGTLTSDESQDLTVDGQVVEVDAGQFETMLQLPDGQHLIEVKCDSTTLTRTITVHSGVPRFVIDTPRSGALFEQSAGPIEVRGRLDNALGIDSISMNGQPVMLGPTGNFITRIQPQPGINHLDFLVNSVQGEAIDVRRSFLYGQFTDWSAQDDRTVVVDIREAALAEVARTVEDTLTDDVLEDMLDEHMGRRGDLELHEIKYDRLELELNPRDNRLRVKLQLHDFRLKFTYHYSVIGIGGRIRGWARCRPAEIEADVTLLPTSDGGYDLRVDDPQVRLRDFDLDLNDFYSIVEGLIQPMVHDIGRDAMVKAMRDVVLNDLIKAELLNQELDLLGQTTRLKVHVNQLGITPQGIHGSAHATIDSFPVVNQAPGFWTSEAGQAPRSDGDDMSLAMNVNLFNRMLAEAWRGGLFDIDLSTVLEEQGSLSAALLLGPAGPEMATHIPPASAVEMKTKALMQPIVVVDDPRTGRLGIHLGSLQLTLSSQNHQGVTVDWAVAEISLELLITPTYANGDFQVQANLTSRMEIVEAPLFPLDESALETFLEAITAGLTGPTLDQAVNDMFRFGDMDILGLSVGGVRFSNMGPQTGYLYLGLDLVSQ